ncbi:MAG TPA: alpha/beta hydrolase [Phycisphaerales bacterium]|nr:alpha/beta hydrolase [Phycisphaerales bacterium]
MKHALLSASILVAASTAAFAFQPADQPRNEPRDGSNTRQPMTRPGSTGRERTMTPARPTARMQELLDELNALEPKAIETLTPAQARKQPTFNDAVKAWLKKHKDQAPPKVPEEVADVDDMRYELAAGADGNAIQEGAVLGAGKEKIRIYKPLAAKDADKNKLWPVIVYWHGGGFVTADIDSYDSSCRALANASGCIVASAEYRKAPENPFPAAANDAVAAYRWVLANAREFGGDPANVSVAGESAGGNLAAVVCLSAKTMRFQMPTHQLLIYPVVQDSLDTPSARTYANAKPLNRAMMTWFLGHYAQSAAEKTDARTDDAPPPTMKTRAPDAPAPDWRMFPLYAPDHSGLPPTTIVLAEIDPLCSDGEMYGDALRSSGVPVRQRRFAGVTHEFFGLGAVLPEAREAVAWAAEGVVGFDRETGGEAGNQRRYPAPDRPARDRRPDNPPR